MQTMRIIVSGHGTFATGIKGALELLAKIPSNWQFVNFSNGMSESDLQAKFQELLAENPKDQVVFFTDLVGGTPFKTAVMCGKDHDRVQVVAGGNLGSLLEIIFSEFKSAKDCADKIVSTSLAGTQRFDVQAPMQNNGQKNDETGI